MTTHRLTLEFEVIGEESIAGRLSDATGHAVQFVGWLGLAGALEELSGDTDPRRTQAPDIASRRGD